MSRMNCYNKILFILSDFFKGLKRYKFFYLFYHIDLLII